MDGKDLCDERHFHFPAVLPLPTTSCVDLAPLSLQWPPYVRAYAPSSSRHARQYLKGREERWINCNHVGLSTQDHETVKSGEGQLRVRLTCQTKCAADSEGLRAKKKLASVL